MWQLSGVEYVVRTFDCVQCVAVTRTSYVSVTLVGLFLCFKKSSGMKYLSCHYRVCFCSAQPTVLTGTLTDYKTSLQSLQNAVQADSTNIILIHRSRILQSTLLAVSRPRFSYNHLVQVEFVGEQAQDCGGPRREYFRWYIYINLSGNYGYLYFSFSTFVHLLRKHCNQRFGM